MKKIFIIIVSLILISAVSATGTYFITKHYTFTKAYATGKDIGYKAAKKQYYSKGYDDGWAKSKEIFDDDTGYQSYFSNQAPVSTPATTYLTHCTTMTYGINSQFTSTDCN